MTKNDNKVKQIQSLSELNPEEKKKLREQLRQQGKSIPITLYSVEEVKDGVAKAEGAISFEGTIEPEKGGKSVKTIEELDRFIRRVWMKQELPTTREIIEKGIAPAKPLGFNIFRKSITYVGAPEDSFKTQWAVQLAISLTLGKPCYGYSCKKCIVLYAVLEGAKDYILERIEEKVEAMGVDRDEVLSNLFVVDLTNKSLSNKDDVLELKERMLQTPADVIFLDPISALLAEDERFSSLRTIFATNLLEVAETIDGAIVLIAHCRKGTHNNNDMDEIAGHSVMKNLSATRIKFFRHKDRKDWLSIYQKTRYAERPEKIELRWKAPLLEMRLGVLKPREIIRKEILKYLAENGEQILSEFTFKIAEKIKHNSKTVRIVLDNLEIEGEIRIDKVPHSAKKIVKRIST